MAMQACCARTRKERKGKRQRRLAKDVTDDEMIGFFDVDFCVD